MVGKKEQKVEQKEDTKTIAVQENEKQKKDDDKNETTESASQSKTTENITEKKTEVICSLSESQPSNDQNIDLVTSKEGGSADCVILDSSLTKNNESMDNLSYGSVSTIEKAKKFPDIVPLDDSNLTVTIQPSKTDHNLNSIVLTNHKNTQKRICCFCLINNS